MNITNTFRFGHAFDMLSKLRVWARARIVTFCPLQEDLSLKIWWLGHECPPRSKLFCCVWNTLSLLVVELITSKLIYVKAIENGRCDFKKKLFKAVL